MFSFLSHKRDKVLFALFFGGFFFHFSRARRGCNFLFARLSRFLFYHIIKGGGSSPQRKRPVKLSSTGFESVKYTVYFQSVTVSDLQHPRAYDCPTDHQMIHKEVIQNHS